MKRMLVFTATAMLAAVPAVAGLAGNTSLSPSVPVVPPAQAVVLDDRGGLVPRDDRTEAGDDNGVTTSTSSPTATQMPSTDDATEIGEDNGGATARDDRVEPGDDRDLNGASAAPGPTTPPSTDDSRHHSSDDASGAEDSGGGVDDGSGHDVGDDHGGHGSDG